MIDIPGYSIKREIGAGGMASVYLAVQTSLEREVALKVMAPALAADPAFSKRFLQEARMLASLAHPNIVAVYDVGVTPGQAHYFSMQYLPGGDFADRVQRGLDERELTLTLAGVARALAYAHQRGYVHRDVAPGNILYDASNNPVLTDFGIALAATSSSRITSAGFSVGTSHYMSPEQARGGDVDARSDIYSLGVMAYFGLVGKPPYEGTDGFAVAYAHVFEPVPRLPADKAHWQPLIDRALAKDPKDRYSDAAEFLDGMAAVVPQYAPLFRDEAALGVAAEAVTVQSAPIAAITRDASNGSEPATRPMLRTPSAEAPTLTYGPRVSTAVAPPAALASPVPRRQWLHRVWPLAIVVAGIGLIGFALLSRHAKTTPATPQVVAANLPKVVAAVPAPAVTPALASIDEAAPQSIPAAAALPDGIDVAEAQAAMASGSAGEFPTVVDPVVEAIRLARSDLAALRLTLPRGDNALERFQFALKLDPRNKAAKSGIAAIAKKYIDVAQKKLADGDAVQFDSYLQRASDVAKLVPDDADSAHAITAARKQAAAPFLEQAKTAAAAWNKPAATAAYTHALQLDPDNSSARTGLKFVATIGEPGFVFRDKLADATAGPEMVIVDAHLAMARHEVTRGEFRRFWAAAGRAKFGNVELSCRDRESIFRSSKKRGWQNPDIAQDDSHPVVCVGWREAAAYAQWLSKQSSKHYRLTSPAEFDRIARHAPGGACKANLADAAYKRQYNSRDGSDCDDGFVATAPVGRFAPVAGVYDIDGNVREWVGACANGAPAQADSSCHDFMSKGRGWLSLASKEAPTFSDTYAADVGLNTLGFRVVRDVNDQ